MDSVEGRQRGILPNSVETPTLKISARLKSGDSRWQGVKMQVQSLWILTGSHNTAIVVTKTSRYPWPVLVDALAMPVQNCLGKWMSTRNERSELFPELGYRIRVFTI